VTTKTEGIFNKPFIHVLAIIFIAFLVYSNTFNAPFQFDDITNIVDNPSIKDLHYFSDPSRVELADKSNFFSKPLFRTRYIGYLSFALNYKLNKLDVTGYHLVNIFIHILNSLLLYRFMTLTFRGQFFSGSGRQPDFSDSPHNLIAVFTALFFAVHPIQTQAVTYIVQRFTSLATLFYLIALVMYIKWKGSREQQAKRPAASALFYTASLFSAVLAIKTKEFAFTLPFVMAMYELMFFDGKIKKRLLYLVPFFLGILLIPLSLTGTGGSLADISGINEEAVHISGATGNISRGEYLFTQFRVIVTYIRLLFVPVNQNIDYDYPIFRSFFSPAVVLSFLFLLSVIIAGVYLYRLSKRPETKDRFWLRLISFGIFFFFMTLSAESGVIPINDVIFEHRVYLPSIGFFLALAGSIGAGVQRWGTRTAYVKKAILHLMLMVMLALSGATYARNALWNNSIRLWGNAVGGSPNKARTHNNLGVAYRDQGRFNEAINEHQIALKLKPDYVDAHNNLGVAYAKQGRIDEAIKEYMTALKISPENARVHNNLGNAYSDQGRSDEAIKEYQAALKINAGHVSAHTNLGLAYAKQRRIDAAVKEFEIALKLKPDFANAHYYLGIAYAKQGRIDEAAKEFKIALKLKPEFARASKTLDSILKK
jgi:tetratricopeptide (TPR) repeat protein